MLKINWQVEKEFLKVNLSGVLTKETLVIFDVELMDLINNLQINNLKIDLVELDYIDEAGFDKIMLMLKRVKKVNRYVI